MNHPLSERLEVAQAIAAHIAESHAPWSAARLAVLSRLDARTVRSLTPSAAEIESALREHYALFCPEEHAATLATKRRTAAAVMQRLAPMPLYLCSSVLNGAAHEDSNIVFELFEDDEKSVLIALMEAGFEAEAIEAESGAMPEPSITLGFLTKTDLNGPTEGIELRVHRSADKQRNPYARTPDAHQSAWESSGRIDLKTLLAALNPY